MAEDKVETKESKVATILPFQPKGSIIAIDDLSPEELEFKIGILEAVGDLSPHQEAMLRLFKTRFEAKTEGVSEDESEEG